MSRNLFAPTVTLQNTKVGTKLRRTGFLTSDSYAPINTEAEIIGVNNEPEDHVRVDILVDGLKAFSFDYYPCFCSPTTVPKFQIGCHYI